MNFFRKNLPTNRRSQIAVIITFVIAVIFLFIAVFINLSKVSQIKTTTSTAADKAALGLASQLGSMSHYYKEKVLKISGACPEPCQACNTDWVSLVVLVGIAAITGAASFFFLPALFLGTAIGAISMTMLTGINAKFKEMTGYNSLRESTLFEALRSTQSDDVELKKKEPGIFYEDNNGNGVFDTGEKVYNLSGMPEMLNQPKVDRFSAWYYTYRLALLRDEDKGTEEALSKFIDGKTVGIRDGLKKFIDIDNWSSAIWEITDLSYIIGPGGGGSRDYDVTCSGSSCPSWVKDPDPAKELLRMVRINSSNVAYGGFLNDKLISLLTRLEASYNLSFCNELGCSEADNLIIDLGEFLRRTKEVINLPASQRLNNLTQWFLAFYDFKEHKADRTSIHDVAPTPNDDPYLDDDYSYDIYLRLIRDQVYINRWIPELETLNNNTVTPDIKNKHGECTWGRGASVSSTCYTQYGCSTSECGCHCCGSDCSDCCCNTCCYPSSRKSPCAWEGTYYTCCQNPPVCSNGDLYGIKPGWCANHKDHADCHSNCGCSVQSFNCDGDAKSFQGQLAYDNTSGPTEVEQVIRILKALDDDIGKIKLTISDLADKVENMTTDTSVSPFRNEIIYAWKDKPKPDGGEQFSHLAQVKIEGYPIKLPYVSESIEWGGLQKCRTLNNYKGDFKITTSRYDQDQPTDIGKTDNEGWKLKRRKTPASDEFPLEQLENIVADVQDNGTINTTQAGVNNILTNYAITSVSQVHYGPEKSDIYITKTKSD